MKVMATGYRGAGMGNEPEKHPKCQSVRCRGGMVIHSVPAEDGGEKPVAIRCPECQKHEAEG